MTKTQEFKGRVTSFDGQRGVASIELEDGEIKDLPAGAFFSGRSSRLPITGDDVSVRVREGRAVLARLVSET